MMYIKIWASVDILVSAFVLFCDKQKKILKIYFFFIRPALEYADVKWDDIPEYLTQK